MEADMHTTIRPLASLATAALCALLTAAPAVAAPTFAITGPSAVQPGAALQLAITASDVADLYAYQFDIQFDATRFSAVNLTQGGLLGTAGTTFFDGGQVDNTAGTVSLVFESLIGPGAGAVGSGTLATLNLTALVSAAAGSASFSLSNVTAYDAGLNPLDITLQGHAVAVPEPAAWSLALVGLAGLGLFGTRRAARPAPAGV